MSVKLPNRTGSRIIFETEDGFEVFPGIAILDGHGKWHVSQIVFGEVTTAEVSAASFEENYLDGAHVVSLT